jgi:hypothetical protein
MLGPGAANAVVVGAGTDPVLLLGSTPGDSGDGAVWQRVGGDGWAAAPIGPGGAGLGGPNGQTVEAAVQGDGVTVAVGWATDHGGTDAAAWAANDPKQWARSPHRESVFGGDQAQRMLAVTMKDGVALAVGWSGSTADARDAAVWLSAPVASAGKGSTL